MYFTSGIQLSDALAALPGSKVGTYVAFDPAFYALTYMGTYQGTLTPLEHFVQVGADRMYKPNSTFDPAYYANKYDDLRGAGLNSADLIYHFMQYGLDEGRAPSEALAKFDGNFYLAANPDVAAYVNANLAQFGGSVTNGALAHYVKFGAVEGRDAPGAGGKALVYASAASVDEGDTVTFTIAVGQPNFTYTYDLTGVVAADVVGGALTGTVTTDANGNGTFTVALANDRVTDGVDTLVATLPNTGLSASVSVNDTSLNNIAPVAVDATGATTEAGAVVAGQLVATDAENDAVTFALDAAVEGLTLNADGTYSFDPALNTAAQALTYKSDALQVVANYTVTDALGATDAGTLTITVTPKPLTFAITADKTSAEEGATTVYTVKASEAVIDPVDVVFTLQPGDGLAVNAGTANTNTADFATGAFNPTTVTMAAGADTATFDVVAVNDATTELQESYSVKAEITGQPTLNLSSKVVDATGAGGVGQTFTLTTGIDTIPGLIGSANSAGTDGNDTIVALLDSVGTTETLTALDKIDGGLGNNTMTLNAIGAVAAVDLDVATITNVQTINVRGTAAVVMDLTANAGITGVTALNSTQSTGATLKAADTTDIGVSGSSGAIAVDGGKNVTVTDAATGTITIGAATVNKGTITVTDTKTDAAIAINGGTDVTVTASGVVAAGTTTIGAATAATGAVVVNSTGAAFVAATDATLGAIAVTGGKTISVTQVATSDASAVAADKAGGTVTQGAVTIVAAATTTDVTVKQDATRAETLATDKTGGATETASVKFTALTAGQTLVMGGLTFTATVAMTAAEAAAAFSNLVQNAAFAAPATIAAGDTQSAAAAGKGVYTGAFTGWTSGAAVGDTVVFTSTAPNTNPADLANTGTGAVTVTTTTGAVHNAGASGGVMGVATGVVDITGGAALANVTVDGYAAAAANQVQGATNTALATVNLSNGGNFTVASAASALALNLTNVNGTVDVTAGTTTLNATVNGTGTATLTSGSATSVKVGGAGNVAGVAGAGLAVATAIDTTAMTAGTAAFTLDSTAATYAGGAGADSVTFSNATAATKALDLGAGNDTLTFAAGTVAPSVVLKGGAGDDTVSLVAADAVTLSGSTAFAAQLDSFERLALTGATGAQAVDLGKLGFTNHVTVGAFAAAGVLTLTDLANNGTVVLTGDVGTGVTVAMKDAATGTADVLNAQLSKDGVLAGGVLTAANVESVNLTVTDPVTSNGIATHTLTLTADKATSVNVTGNAGLTLTMTGSTTVTSIDGSTMTGGLTVTSLNTTDATTIKGGAGADVLTAATGVTADVLEGGAGNDVLVGNAGLSTLTGGAGNDVFVLNVASLDVNSYATITDFSAGDLLEVTGISAFKSAKVTLGDTAVFQDYANAAINALAATEAGWFQFGGNTYVVADMGAETTTFTNAQDWVIKLTGLVDLTNASFNDTEDTIAL